MEQKPTNAPTAAGFLSNGRYFTFITAAGTGQSRRHGHVVNRWAGDPVTDADGQFVYLRDVEAGQFWSIGRQPTPCDSGTYQAAAAPGQFRLQHENAGIQAILEIAVPPHHDLEIRRLRLQNNSGRPRRIEITSYFEAVLNSQAADRGHPAFSKLFLQTEYRQREGLLTVDRRPRSSDERWPTLFHTLCGALPSQWETDRLRFLGRGRNANRPLAWDRKLSGTIGNVLDPCCSLRTTVELADGTDTTISFLTGIVEGPEAASHVAGLYRTPDAISEAFAAAEEAEHSLWNELRITSRQAAQFQNLAAAMLAGERGLKPAAHTPPAQVDANAIFRRLGIPHDRLLIVCHDGWESPAAKETALAREYLARKGLFTNLLVVDAAPTQQPAGFDDRVFTRPPADLKPAERQLLSTAAALVVNGSLPNVNCDWSPPPAPARLPALHSNSSAPLAPEELAFFNGYGGFTSDGREYVIQLPWTDEGRKWPPLPWINVIANEHAGFLISESGAGCAWARNSQANRITPWSNDPVGDPHGEALYLRDESSGQVFSPFPGPIESPVSYTVRHGFGYSVFESTADDLHQVATLFMPLNGSLLNEPVRITHLKLTNRGPATKALSLFAYHDLVLGSASARPSLIATRLAPDGSLRAVNPGAGDFQPAEAFAALSIAGQTGLQSYTCDRESFLGRYGSPRNPAGLHRGALLNERCGAGLDPCFVQQQALTLAPGESVECVLLLGEAPGDTAASEIIAKVRNPDVARTALEEVKAYWRTMLGTVQVTTPSQKLNFLVNGWLPYQTLGCRLWARSAFYQSSGAFGFRDQLQDAGNLLAIQPELARTQILLHAGHQFVEGDVLHWWHPEPIAGGLRTRFADDLLWLPLVTADYVRSTGDAALLQQSAPFLKGEALHEGEDERYIRPEAAGLEASVYEHCCRAIDRSLATGSHGLPLMGCGDWNDGMNRVGREGRGESVWMGFFLYRILGDFLPFCRAQSDAERVETYAAHSDRLREALNNGGWDGEWYRRAYYDNGDPLGSSESDECRIDAIAQAWAVISGAAPDDRARSCIAAMSRELVSESDGIIRLLKPPFVNTPNDPGYIKGYVAGIRENGGQYTHAACWAVMALAMQGENDRALRLWEMLAPISHSESQPGADHYKGEPYVLPGDVYGAPPHVGRCGWTWYTGSSGWLYRVALESILGIRFEDGRTLVVTPCIPDHWPACEVVIDRSREPGPHRRGRCIIRIENPQRTARSIVEATSDGAAIPAGERSIRIPLRHDNAPQHIRLILG